MSKKSGVNFIELEILFREKKLKKLKLPIDHGKNKTYHLTMIWSDIVGLDWNQ